MNNWIAGLMASCACGAPAFAADALSAAQLGSLVATYKDIHAHPELSQHEERTAGLFAAELRKAGYSVTEKIGRYPDGSRAFGVVGILKNGAGPTLMIRADMDALPITEATGVPYASHVKALNAAGQEVGVMHACGHDVHISALIGTARVLAADKAKWHGTLMLVGQPAEETVGGARAMLADGLYERFGTPDMIVALHDGSNRAAGTVSLATGPAQASATSIDVVLRGVGGHGAAPQAAVDPIVMAGEFIVQLQTIVSRSQDPLNPSVVTIGSVHGGTRRNIIPNEVKLEITARAFSDRARTTIIEGIERIARGVSVSAGAPADLVSTVTVLEQESTPMLYNDPVLAVRVRHALTAALGAGNVFDDAPIMPSEDFGAFGLPDRRIPVVMFWLGAADPQKLAAAQAAGRELPGPHTNRFEPSPEPTLQAAVTAMAGTAEELLR
jgi:amidohydrolase